MRAVDLIRKKRDSGEHSREEIDFLVSGYTRGEIPDYQMSAWLMATWIRGLSGAEIASLRKTLDAYRRAPALAKDETPKDWQNLREFAEQESLSAYGTFYLKPKY